MSGTPGGRSVLQVGVRRDGSAAVVVLVRRRSVAVSAVLLMVALLAAVATLTAGRLGIPLVELAGVLAGRGDRTQHWVMFTARLPRLAVAALAGAAFAIAGAVFQSVTRNPLGSPDIIGLGAGAAAGAAVSAIVLPGYVPVPVGALLGSAAAVVAVYLGTGRGFAAPHRMVVTGIAVAAMALAFVQFALVRTSRESAQEVASWLIGSLAARSWRDVAVITVVLGVIGPVALALSRHLQLAEMGDDLAVAAGSPVGRARALAVLAAVVLTGGAVAVCGPVAFVALTAPQIARRLTGASGPGVVAAACCGAAVLVLADLVAQFLVPGVIYPVGIVTAGLGGGYLAFLLVREWRRVAV